MRARWVLAITIFTLASGCSSGSGQTAARTSAFTADTRRTRVEPPPVTAAPTTSMSTVPVAAAPAPVADIEDNPLPIEESDASPVVRPRSTARATSAAKPAAIGKPTSTGSIEIPAIGLTHLTYEGIDLAIINYGPSHWPGTAAPGQRGNTVFPGHRTTYSRPFWDIDKLVVGNEVIFTTPAGRFVYRVTKTFVVNATDTWVADATPDATFTILACHPKGSAKQRYVVKGSLVSAPPPLQPLPTTPAPTAVPPRRGFLGIF